MKKQILLFLLSIFLLNAAYTQLHNGGFENWLTVDTYQLEEWQSFGQVSPYSPGNAGNYGVRLQYDTIDMATSFILHGSYVDGIGFTGGVPFAARPDSLVGFFKSYSPNPGDMAVIHLILKKNGTHLCSDFFLIPQTPDTVNYHRLSFGITYNHPTEIPDSLIILVTHPNPFQDTIDGGFLIVDDLHFTNTALPIPNGDFENWHTTSYDQAQNWLSYNFAAHHHPQYPVRKTTDAYGGSYAARIQNSLSAADTIPGVLLYSEDLKWGEGALTMDERYTSFKGYYKYLPQNADTMQMYLVIYKADTVVGFAHKFNYQPVPAYTKFDIPVYYLPGFIGQPDSAVVLISAYGAKPLGNSVLYVDEVTLVKNTNILINEFMASNSFTVFDFAGDAEDWIELYNAGTSPVLLHNFTLSDDSLELDMWRFPPVVIEPDSFMTIYASGKDLFYPEPHTNFRISRSGEPLILSSPTGHICDFLQPVALESDISYGRYPDGSPVFKYFAKPTPGKSNNTSQAFNGISYATPAFSVHGGFFEAPFNLDISINHPTAVVRYSLDGSEPNTGHPAFSQPLLIDSRIGDTNTISMISETSLSFLPPAGEVFKSNVIRAKAFIPDSITVKTVTHTYFVDTGIFSKYNTPVLSLVTDNDNLFDSTIGIYVLGDKYYEWQQQNPNDSLTLWHPANYLGRGDAWERPVHLEYFENTGVTGLRQDAGLRIHGGASRTFNQKSLRLYARNKYGPAPFSYPVFDGHTQRVSNLPLEKFDRLMLRSSGNDWGRTFFRDGLMHSLIAHTKLDVMAFQPAVVFLNGEYWGFHNIRERMDKYYISRHYNIDADDVAILEGHGSLNTGYISDQIHYYGLHNYVDNNDMSQNLHYDYVKTLMDVENFMLYQAVQIYYRNTDWPGNNIKFWRKRTDNYIPHAPYGKDGRWRWLFYDLDFGFGLIEGLNAHLHNTLEYACEAGNTQWPNPDWSTLLFRNLLENTNFRNGFINTMADHINTSFLPHRMLDVIDSLKHIYAPGMQEHIERWRLPVNLGQWDQHINILHYFALNRSASISQHIMDKWQISGTYNLTLDVNNLQQGFVQINTILIDDNTKGIIGTPYPWTGKYFNDIPVSLKAIPKPGYKFVEWLETGDTQAHITLSLNQAATYTALFEEDTAAPYMSLYINEFMASNSTTITDAYGEYDDWIEIYNASADTVDIGGFYITDKLDNPTRHLIPIGFEDTKIPPQGFLLLWADGTPEQGVLHTNFKLSASGEAIGLFAPDGVTVIDTLTFGQQVTDISFGRYPDGSSNIILFNTPTPGASNVISSIKDISVTDNAISLFPNPVSNTLLVSQKVEKIKVYNTLGQLVLKDYNKNSIDVSGLPQGIYFVRINKTFVGKITVQ